MAVPSVPHILTNSGAPIVDAVGLNDNFGALNAGFVNVMDERYGATGNGTTDDTTAIQNAMNACPVGGTVWFPTPATYLVTNLALNKAIALRANRPCIGAGAVLKTVSNQPIITATSGSVVDGFSFLGDGDAAKTAQVGVWVNDTDGQITRNCDYTALYNGHRVTSTTSGGFDNYLWDSQFISGTNAYILGDATTSGGFGLSCKEVTLNTLNPVSPYVGCPAYGIYSSGQGVLNLTGVRGYGNYRTAGVCIASYAANGGESAWTDVQIENHIDKPGLQLIGTAAVPIKFLNMTNTYFAGGTSSASCAVEMTFVKYCNFTNFQFTNGGGTGPGGLRFLDTANIDSLTFCGFQPQVAGTAVKAMTANVAIGNLHINGVIFSGATFFDFGSLAAANPALPPTSSNYGIGRHSVIGNINGATLSIAQGGPAGYASGYISPNDAVYLCPGTTMWKNTGKFVASGNGSTTAFNIAHGLHGIPQKISLENGSSVATGAHYVTPDATNIVVTFVTAPASGASNITFYWTAEL